MILRTSFILVYLLFSIKISIADDIPIIVIAPSKIDQSYSTVGTSVTSLNNEEIQDILQKNSTKGDLQQRLRHDFIVDQKIYKIIPLREKPSAVLAVKKRIPSKIPSIKSSKRKSSKRKSSTKKSSMRKTHKRKTSKRKTTKKTSSSSSSKKSSRRSSRIERIRRQVKKHLATPRPKIKRIHLTK